MPPSLNPLTTHPPHDPKHYAQRPQTSRDCESAADNVSGHNVGREQQRMRGKESEGSFGLSHHNPMPPSQEPWLPSTSLHRDACDASAREIPARELPALQANSVLEGSALDQLLPITADDPSSFELVASANADGEEYSLEKRSLSLFSREHLQVIFADPSHLLKFTSFGGVHRPKSVPLLIYYLNVLKALRTLHYANAILQGLDPIADVKFTQQAVQPTVNAALEERANIAFEQLVKDELPAYITHQYIQIVSASISSYITGSLAPHLRDASEGLAEVFCLTDPSRADNPIVFASEGGLRASRATA
jgi:hypothetical protein